MSFQPRPAKPSTFGDAWPLPALPHLRYRPYHKMPLLNRRGAKGGPLGASQARPVQGSPGQANPGQPNPGNPVLERGTEQASQASSGQASPSQHRPCQSRDHIGPSNQEPGTGDQEPPSRDQGPGDLWFGTLCGGWEPMWLTTS